MHARRESAYSLLELMMTLALVATLLLAGIPAFTGFTADKRLRAETDALFHAVHLARKSSVVRRRVVTICPSADGQRCDPSGDWSEGWIVYEESSASDTGSREPGEPLLVSHPVDDRVVIEANRRSFSFRSTHLRATNGTLRICGAAGRGRPRALIVSYTGRPRVTVQELRNGVSECALS